MTAMTDLEPPRRLLIERAATAGFEVLRSNVGAVLVWALVFLAGVIASLAVQAPEIYQTAQRASAGDLSQSPTLMFTSIVATFISMLPSVLVCAAVWRAVLEPEERRMAFLRLSTAELWVFGQILLVTAGSLALIGVWVGASYGLGALLQSQGLADLVWIPWVAGGAVALGATIYLNLRLALAGPIAALEGRFAFADSWRMTSGRVLPMVWIGLVNWIVLFFLAVALFILFFVILLVLSVMVFGTALIGATSGAGGDPAAAFANAGIGMVVALILGGILVYFLLLVAVTCLAVVANAPWADVLRQLRGSKVEQTFA